MHEWEPLGLFDHIIPRGFRFRASNSFGIPMKFKRRTSIGLPMELEDWPVREITIPLDPKSPWEELLFQLNYDLSKLEKKLSALEAEIQFPRHHPNHTWDSLSLHQKVQVLSDEISCNGFVFCKPESQRELYLLTKRMELLCYEALSYELSAQSNRDRFLVSLIVPRFESLLKERCTMIREKHLKLSEIKDKLARFQPDDDMMLWKLTCFPRVEPVEWHQRPRHGDIRDIFNELGPLLESALYPEDMEEGDVLSYLPTSGGELIRRNGKRVALNMDTFRQKYVCVCCFHVPFFYPTLSLQLYNLINLCQELYSTRQDDFEMVVVAKMNALANTEEVFNHFFSAFPESCLAVPFEDCQKRDYICKLLGLDSCLDRYESLFLGPEGQVLNYLFQYGAEAFPFAEAIFDRIHEECQNIVLNTNKVGLETVLKCNDDSPRSLCKFSPSGDILEEVPISNFSCEVSNKHVGLYLCGDGDLLPKLKEMYDKCREEQLEFEIVVVNMPFTSCTDPKIQQREICSWLQDHNASDWWCLPYNNSVSLRFWRLTESADMNHLDKLIVVGPEVARLDMYGSVTMAIQGIDAFPFTREAGIKRTKEKLEEMTLDSLFAGDVSFFRGKNEEDRKSLRQLVNGGKKIVVCIDQLYPTPEDFGHWDWDYEFGTLVSVYNKLGSIEGESCNVEMVFVEVGNKDKVRDEDRKKLLSRMPWYICPREMTNSSIVKKLSKWFMPLDCSRQDALIGFGEDGRLCSYVYKYDVEDRFFPPLDINVSELLGYNEFTDFCSDNFSYPRPK